MFPSRLTRLSPPDSLRRPSLAALGIRSLHELGNQLLAPHPHSALPPSAAAAGCTSMHFGENQLSPCSFGISPLPTAPPLVLQHQWVRASTDCHIRFTLAMGSSHGFGSHRRYLPPGSPGGCALFRLGFPPAPLLSREVNLRQRRCTRRIILQKARHQPARGACSDLPQSPGVSPPACHGMGL